MSWFYKIFIGKPEYNIHLPYPAVKNQKLIIKRIWNNETHNDTGLEKILRLFLASVQFCFPAIYMRHLLWKKGYMYQSMAIELYVLFKMSLALFFLISGWCQYALCIFIVIYQLFETLFYISTLLFVSDELLKPRSYRRSVLLLIVDYFQINFAFSSIYLGMHILNSNAKTVVEYLYFSFITSATIGFGDIFPVTQLGKIIVCFHSIFFFVFVVLFINYFSSKVEVKDYYDHEAEKSIQ